jgi:hypothetical protein
MVGSGDPFADHAARDDFSGQRRYCQRADHFPAGAIGRLPQLGLPFLLAPRRDLHFARADERGLDEAKRWRAWLIRAIGGEPSLVQIFYGIGGERFMPERTLPWLSGYEGAKPVRVGNAAAAQLQLDIYGEVLDALFQSRDRRLVSDAADWMLQIELLKHLEIIWEFPDEGIWEVRGPRRHFTHSKVMAWVAFDRGSRASSNLALSGRSIIGGACASVSMMMSARMDSTRSSVLSRRAMA